jgi:hypothetical protein
MKLQTNVRAERRRAALIVPKHRKQIGRWNPPEDRSEALRTLRNLKEHLPVAYSKYLGDTLAERIKELAEQPPEEQLDLSEDLALVRITARDAAIMYDALYAQELSDVTEGTTKTRLLEARLAAGQILRDALKQVADMCEQYVRVAYAPNRATVGVTNINLVVGQLMQEAHEVFGESPEMIAKVMELADRAKRIRLPNEDQMTTITPDMDVLAMDKTIPAAPEAAQPLRLAQ